MNDDLKKAGETPALPGYRHFQGVAASANIHDEKAQTTPKLSSILDIFQIPVS